MSRIPGGETRPRATKPFPVDRTRSAFLAGQSQARSPEHIPSLLDHEVKASHW